MSGLDRQYFYQCGFDFGDTTVAAKRYKVFLADPSLDAHGLDVAIIPFGAGLIASYLQHHLPHLEVEVFRGVTPLLEAIKERRPDAIGFSNYMWNTNVCVAVAEYARKVNDNTLIVFGGPEIDSQPYDVSSFEHKYNVVDLFVQHEGEVAFLNIIDTYISCDGDVDTLKSSIHTLGNCFYIGATGTFIRSPTLPRITDLDDIPSPFLMGLFDKFLADGNCLPMIQTNRGCPFSCTFCQEGVQYFTKVNRHSLDFVSKELDYIAERVNPSAGLFITDSNWAMYKEDVEIAQHLSEVQAQFKWPQIIISSTGKANLGRIIEISDLLNGAMFISNSVQTMSNDVLKTIKRTNLKSSELAQHKDELATMRQEPEIIVPLPKETKASFLAGLDMLLNVETPKRFAVFQTLVLSNSELGEGRTIEEYDMDIKFKQHSSFMGYVGDNFVCETERVVVSTASMSTKELCECLTYSMLLDALLRFEPVPEIFYYLDSKHVQRSRLTRYMLNSSKGIPPGIMECIEEFRRHFQDELFDTEEEVVRYMEDHWEEYRLGLRGGGNLIYSNRPWIDYFDSMIEWMFSCLDEIMEITEETRGELQALKEYLLMVYLDRRDCSVDKPAEVTRTLSFDIQAWSETLGRSPLQEYRRTVSYKFKKTELSGVDKTTIWKSFGFQRERGEEYTGVQEERLYLVKMRREIERLLDTPIYYEHSARNKLVGKLPLKY